MRAVLLLSLVAALVGGCGQAGEPREAGGSTAAATQAPARPDSPSAPEIVLVSSAGTQHGTPGSSCVDDPAKGVGVCADSATPRAKELTVVRPGDTVVVRLVGAHVVRSAGCHARDRSCIGQADVTLFGCPRRIVGTIWLERGEETRWRVPDAPGTYELQVFAYFEADDGRSGDVSAALGLEVDPAAPPAIEPARARPGGCR